MQQRSSMEFNEVQWGQLAPCLGTSFETKSICATAEVKEMSCRLQRSMGSMCILQPQIPQESTGSGSKVQKSMRPDCWGSHMVVAHDLHRCTPLRHNDNPNLSREVGIQSMFDPFVQNLAPYEIALAMLASSCTICIRISLVLEPRPRFVECVWKIRTNRIVAGCSLFAIESELKPFFGNGYGMFLRDMKV